MNWRTLATGAGLAAGALGALDGLVFMAAPTSCGLDLCLGGPSYVLTALWAVGAALLVVSASTIVGPDWIFYAEAVLSALLALIVIGASSNGEFYAQWLTLAVALAAVVASAMATRARAKMSEQANPMNLPVFG